MSQETTARRPMKRETLADRVAADITERILSNALAAGSALPTEPELAEEYDVSRSVIRDASKLLSARGLVEIRHGKGVFVTHSQREGFENALLLALRREHASVWDAEEFIDRLFLVAVSLAIASASDAEIEQIDILGKAFLESLDRSSEITDESDFAPIAQAAQDAHNKARMAVFAATHNKVIQHLAEPLLSLRRLRTWDFTQVLEHIEDLESLEGVDVRKADEQFHTELMNCLRNRDAGRVFTALADLLQVQLPPQAVGILKRTPIGESPHIVLTEPLPESLLEAWKGKETSDD